MQMKRQQGFGLLEILITLVVLGVAVAGLVSLSKSALTASQDGRRYEIAMRLAESKIDEFRNFHSEADYNAIANGSASKTMSNDLYTLTWTKTDKYWNSATSAWQNTAPAGYLLPTSGRKQITTTVSWINSTGQLTSVALTGDVSPVEALTSGGFNGGLDTARTGPKVTHTPGQLPDVVSVDLGNGSKQETSKPLPHISGKSSNSLLIQFDNVTYQTTGNSSTKQAQQDTATASCSCSRSGSGNAYQPIFPYYDSSAKAQYWAFLKDQNGVQKTVSKPVGVLNGSNQEDLCPSCCRDHYDVTNTGFFGYFDPLNPSRSIPSGAYNDACRFVRIDGYYRPAPDWHLASLTIFSANFLNDPTNLTNYKAYITDVVTTYAKWQQTTFAGKNDSSWFTAAVSSPAIQSFNDWLAVKYSNAIPAVNNTTLTTAIGSKQLISRGIYVDIMSPSYLSDEVFKGGATAPDLTKIPFQDVNMTLLSDWSSSDSSKASVTSLPIATIVDPDNNYYGTYSRGMLNAKSTTITGSGTPPPDNPVTITARSYRDNFGVVGAPVLSQDINSTRTATTTMQS
ncbi:prepilin-type N-terminal cleavage/methylation domain-containing protein [Aeromonas media]|uniref:type IV pilus modification PilV family protein n=1 Tax=Aeromonas media TaxID=651 RepID=UPI0038CF6788